jgi:hypothetical protein
MSSCNYSSNISGNVNINSINNSGARLLMTIPITSVSGGFDPTLDGVTGGDVIRYDPVTSLYVKSQGNVSQNAEVVGVIETADSVNNVINVVLQGQIKYPSDRLVNATHVDPVQGLLGASGGNDVYFLSEATGGVLQNLAPNTPTTIAKPVLQVLDDGDFNASVVNYIGYQIGGNAVAEETFAEADGSQRNILNFNGDQLNILGGKWHRVDRQQFLPTSSQDLYANTYDGKLYSNAYSNFVVKAGVRIKCVLGEYINMTGLEGKDVVQKDSTGFQIARWRVVSTDSVNNILWLQGSGTTNVDVGLLLRLENKTYTVSTSVITAFMLPRTRARTNTQFTDYNGKSVSVEEIPVIAATPDHTGVGVTLVQDLTIPTLSVTTAFNVDNDSTSISDLAGLLSDMKTAINAVEDKINFNKSALSQITDKS